MNEDACEPFGVISDLGNTAEPSYSQARTSQGES